MMKKLLTAGTVGFILVSSSGPSPANAEDTAAKDSKPTREERMKRNKERMARHEQFRNARRGMMDKQNAERKALREKHEGEMRALMEKHKGEREAMRDKKKGEKPEKAEKAAAAAAPASH